MPAEVDRAKVAKRAVDLLARAQKPGTKAEGDAAALALGKHIAKHPWLLEHQSDKPTITIAETIDKVRGVAADPKVRETVAAATQAAAVGAEFLKNLSDLAGKFKKT